MNRRVTADRLRAAWKFYTAEHTAGVDVDHWLRSIQEAAWDAGYHAASSWLLGNEPHGSQRNPYREDR